MEIKKKFNNILIGAAVTLASSAPLTVLAAGSKAKEQAEYVSGIPADIQVFFLGILGVAGMIAFLVAGGIFLKDFVLAKSDHDKKFSIAQLLAGVVVGVIFMYPAGIALMADDIVTGGASSIDSAEFKRKTK
ncbi:MAG: hypothetical protein HAW67_06685 [Endozoicomonadaceae bacterium]|nr:hypothetical protein [Endozoicomonadaceae bacterium]